MKSFRSKVFRDFASGPVESVCLPTQGPGLGPWSAEIPRAWEPLQPSCHSHGAQALRSERPLQRSSPHSCWADPAGHNWRKPACSRRPSAAKTDRWINESQLLRRKATVSRCPVPWRCRGGRGAFCGPDWSASGFREPMPRGCALHQYFSFFLSAPVRRDGCVRLVLGTVIPQRQCGVGSYHSDRVSTLVKKPHEFLFLTSRCMHKLYYAIALVIYGIWWDQRMR